MNLGERVNMRVLMVMFDSLNRDMLEPYGGNLVKTSPELDDFLSGRLFLPQKSCFVAVFPLYPDTLCW